jgi:DNA-binding NarL/FixJ family response regulator
MEALAHRVAGPVGSARPSALAVSVGDEVLRARIAAALTEADLPPTPTAAADLAALADDDAAVVVLYCDINRSREVTGLRRARRELPAPAIVVVSPEATGTGLRRGLDAGADAIVFEPEIGSALAIAVLAAVSGQLAVPRKLRASVERPTFSHRERQVLMLAARGLTNNEIAGELFLSESTVKSHLSTAFVKLDVSSRKEATALVLDPQQALLLGLTGLEANVGAGRLAPA